MLKTEVYRNLVRWQLVLASIFLFGLYLHGIEDYRQNLTDIYLYDNNYYSAFLAGQGAGGWSILPILIPLVVALVAGDSLAWDRKTRFIEYINVRIDKHYYFLYKVVSSAITSIIFVGLISFIVFVYCYFTFQSPLDLTLTELSKPTYALELFESHSLLYVIVITINLCLIAMVISAISLLVSIFVKNIYGSSSFSV
ncbi:hypothetical protein [Caldalkalibacillus mannanilyticus]|uniref:hypothetical protein n=1 Tax=Caldalkalibacillus mannanilyticus TaxID=1418 RepID=UPI0004696218|nr:hypothetical protein [Caldalkalibacillus mannanilyticus]